MANGRPNRPIRPRGGGPGGRKRRVVIDSGSQRPRPGDNRQRAGDRQDAKPKAQQPVAAPTGPVSVPSGVTVRDLSQALGIPAAQIIKIMMGLGEMVQITQSLADESVELIAAEVGREVTIRHVGEEDEEPEVFEDAEELLEERPPVVTIMGHVDHGKTTLLDAIRETAVVETEAGGITQHIGAYQVERNGRKITFIDTPGHEAFTAMRARGAKVTDIAVLVVAADDSVMPQTRESISHARAAEVPIVVAVNKIDVPNANPDRVKSDLAAEGLQPEEWGGTTQFAEVSAKQKLNLDELLEKILLVADIELAEKAKANPNAEASGPIIESRLDVGRGPVATMLVQRGTLKVGDSIVAGDAWGRVRALQDYRGEKLNEARPGDPVEILGFGAPPPAGELARVVENERRARELANQRGERLRREQLAKRTRRGVSLESLFTQMQEGQIQDLNLVLKGDVQGSVEALVSELAKIEHPEVRVNVIHQGVGGITENDINLAAASGAMVIGFNVRASRRGARARRARGRGDPPVPRHLPIDAGDRAGARRHAQPRRDRGDPRRGGGARALQGLAARDDRWLHGHERRRPPQRPGARLPGRGSDLRDDDCAAAALQGRRARGDRGLRVRHPPRRVQRPARGRHLRDLRDARGRAHVPRRGAHGCRDRRSRRRILSSTGFVGILSVELHFPESGSLKAKRSHVKSAKAQLQNRFGAAVAEVAFHELWQRCRLTAAVVAREPGDASPAPRRGRALAARARMDRRVRRAGAREPR